MKCFIVTAWRCIPGPNELIKLTAGTGELEPVLTAVSVGSREIRQKWLRQKTAVAQIPYNNNARPAPKLPLEVALTASRQTCRLAPLSYPGPAVEATAAGTKQQSTEIPWQLIW
jgi:hypothetical protein